jgi:hypothetical protein
MGELSGLWQQERVITRIGKECMFLMAYNGDSAIEQSHD